MSVPAPLIRALVEALAEPAADVRVVRNTEVHCSVRASAVPVTSRWTPTAVMKPTPSS